MIIDLKSLNQDLTRCGESCYQLKCSSSLKFFTRKIPPSSEVKLTEVHQTTEVGGKELRQKTCSMLPCTNNQSLKNLSSTKHLRNSLILHTVYEPFPFLQLKTRIKDKSFM